MARTRVLARSGLGVVFVSLLVALVAGPAQAREVGRATGAQDNTAQVCQQMATTIQGGLTTFVGQMRTVGEQAQSGDLVGANATVKQGGATLQTIATQMRQQNNADNAQLKGLLDQMAGQFERLAGQLTDVTGLQNFDTSQLDQLGTQVSSICGPSASFLPPSGSAAPSGAPSRTS